MHSIRLREPWDREETEGGGLLFRRRFGMPTGLGVGCRVWLCADELPTGTLIDLNQKRLGKAGETEGKLPEDASPGKAASNPLTRIEITSALLSRNELCFASPPGSGGRTPLVRLEIEDAGAQV